MVTMMKRLLLGTSTIAGLGLLGGGASPSSALAQDAEQAERGAEVRPGRGAGVTITGYLRTLAIGGDTDNLRLDESLSTGLDFFNDSEVYVVLGGESDATGLRYGGTVEFEVDTNRTDNTDESWVFVDGGFGSIRLGDENGVSDVDGLALSATAIAAGTDGLDSDEFSVLFGGVPTFEPLGPSDATKVRHYTPSFGGLLAGIGYTSNQATLGSGDDSGDNVAARDVEVGDVVEGALPSSARSVTSGSSSRSPGSWARSRTRMRSAATTIGWASSQAGLHARDGEKDRAELGRGRS